MCLGEKYRFQRRKRKRERKNECVFEKESERESLRKKGTSVGVWEKSIDLKGEREGLRKEPVFVCYI